MEGLPSEAQGKPLDTTLTGDYMEKIVSFNFLDGAANNNLVGALARAMKPGDVGVWVRPRAKSGVLPRAKFWGAAMGQILAR